MKNLILIALNLFSAFCAFSQVPEHINFQGIARDVDGAAIANTDMTISINILNDFGNTVYSEEHNTSSDRGGLYTIGIGSGNVIFGSFSDIIWGESKNMNVSIDLFNDNTVEIEFTSPLYSVPYALYAKDVANADDADADPSNELQTLAISGNELSLTNGGSVILPADNVNDADADPSNELQTLAISGNELSLTNGGSVILPADNVDDADADPNNEIQALELNNHLLALTNANTVDLSPYSVIVGSSASDVPSSPKPGQLYFDELSNTLYLYNNGLWLAVPLNNGVVDIYDMDEDCNPAVLNPPIIQSPTPLIHLAENLDEQDQLGWCIDTRGNGFNEQLHTHSCKASGGDVQFVYNEVTHQICSAEFAGFCIEMSGGPVEGSGLILVESDVSSPDQKFIYTDCGEFVPEENTNLCLAAGDTSAAAGIFMFRTLSLELSSETDVNLKRWVIVE